MAYILGQGVLVVSKRLRLAVAKEEREEIEEDDDSFWNLLSKRRAAGGAKEPAEDMAANVDAITPLTYFMCYCNTHSTKNKKTATVGGPGLAFRV
jgi:hypothetical protein